MAVGGAQLPKSGLWRQMNLWARTQTRVQLRCWGMCTLVIVSLLLVSVFRTPSQVVPEGALIMTQADIDRIKQEVAHDERRRYEEKLTHVEQTAAEKKEQFEQQLREAEFEAQKAREHLSTIERDESSEKTSEQQVDLYRTQVSGLEATIVDLKAKLGHVQQQAADERQRIEEGLPDQIEERVVREVISAQRSRYREALRSAFCIVAASLGRLQSQLVVLPTWRNSSCLDYPFYEHGMIKRVVQLLEAEGAVDVNLRAGSAAEADVELWPLEDFRPAIVAGAGADALSLDLRRILVRSLDGTVAEEVSRGIELAEASDPRSRCCDSFAFSATATAGALYHLRVPLLSASVDDDEADLPYRSMCFYRQWAAPEVHELGSPLSALETKATRHVYVVLPVSPGTLPSTRQAVLSLANAAKYEEDRDSGLRMMLLLVPITEGDGTGADVAEDQSEGAGKTRSRVIDGLMSQLADNATVWADGRFVVTSAPPLSQSERERKHLVKGQLRPLVSSARAEAERVRSKGALTDDRIPAESNAILKSAWIASVIATLQAVPHDEDAMLVLEPSVLSVPMDLLSTAVARIVPGRQVYVPVMEASKYVNHKAFGVVHTPGAGAPVQTPVLPVPAVSTFAAAKADVAWALYSLVAIGTQAGEAVVATAESPKISAECASLILAARWQLLGFYVARPHTPGLKMAPSQQAQAQHDFDSFFAGACGCVSPSQLAHCNTRQAISTADDAGDKLSVLSALLEKGPDDIKPFSTSDVPSTVKYLDPVDGVYIVATVSSRLATAADLKQSDDILSVVAVHWGLQHAELLNL